MIPPGVSVIGHYKPFWKSASSDITGGCVHLDVWQLDERLLQSNGPPVMSEAAHFQNGW